jgi:superfamily I DNA/RNA helicase
MYVGITRAKKELVITWNTGRRGGLHPAEPFLALIDYWSKSDKTGKGTTDDHG